MAASELQTETRQCRVHGAYEARVAEVMGCRIVMACQQCTADQAARDAARNKQQALEAQARRIEAMFQRSGIPPRFQCRTLDGYEVKAEGQERALRISRAYAERWPEMRERGTCLIFSGKPGTGKTHLACAIANAVIAQGSSALFTTVGDAMRSIKRAYDRDAGVSEGEAIQALVAPHLLVLDEAGMDYGTDHSKTLLFDVLNKRYEAIRPTIVLTNLDAVALREYLGDRVMDRMREGGGKMIAFAWDSFRA